MFSSQLNFKHCMQSCSLMAILFVLVNSSLSHAAEILVNARPGAFGCDLLEAIESANSSSSIGGCSSGSDGQDTIRFFAGFTRYELPDIEFTSSTGSSGTPEITSDIRIIGQRQAPLVIARPLLQGDTFRAFTVAVVGSLTLENVSLQNFGQTAGFTGGAIRVAGSLTMNNVEIADSFASFGGGIWVQGGSAVIHNSLIRHNRAVQQGGGIGLSAISTVTVFDSTISSNVSDIGAGIALSALPDSNLSLYNTTITENTAAVRGGGLSLLMAGVGSSNSAVLHNNIISGNTAPVSKEAHFVSAESASELGIRNNVLGHSANTYVESVNIFDFVFNNNLPATRSATNAASLRSILGPLEANGGSTMTHALLEGSLAIDAGLQFYVTDGPLFFFHIPGCRGEQTLLGPGEFRPDQRGVARPLGVECDIGAYEYQPPDVGDPPDGGGPPDGGDPPDDGDPPDGGGSPDEDPSEQACYNVKAKNGSVIMFCL